MAHFINGSECVEWTEKNCKGCIHAADGCIILAIHSLNNYEQLDNERIREILNMLIQTSGYGHPGDCEMYHTGRQGNG